MNDTNMIFLNETSESPLEEPQRTIQKKLLKKDKPLIGFRTASRLIAVQGLYAMGITDKRPSEIIADLRLLHNESSDSAEKTTEHVIGVPFPDNFDFDYSLSILCGVVREQRAIDPLITDFLPEGWHFNRLDKVMCAILRAAIYELLFSPDIPPKVTINEYTNIVSSFHLNHDNTLVNGILNAIARSNDLIES